MKRLSQMFVLAVIGIVAYGVIQGTDPKLAAEHQRKEAEKAQQKQKANQDYLDSWAKWAEDMKKKNASQPKEATDPRWKQGFQTGYIAGHMLARGGAEKPDAKKVDAMARKAATAADLGEQDRFMHSNGYESGFWFGWNKGK